LVISHDPARAEALGVETMHGMHRLYNKALPLALNIKADGLLQFVKNALPEFSTTDAFVFDMSVLDAIQGNA